MAPAHRVFRDDASVKIAEKAFGIPDGSMRMGQLAKCVQASVYTPPHEAFSDDYVISEPPRRSIGCLAAEFFPDPGGEPDNAELLNMPEGVYLLVKSHRRHKVTVDGQTSGLADPRWFGGGVAPHQARPEPKRDVVGLPAGAIDNICELLRQLWLTQTANESSMARIYSHPAFRQIVELGEAALPFMFRHLEAEPELWSVGLTMVTGSDSAADAQSPEDAVQAWRSWRETRVGR